METRDTRALDLVRPIRRALLTVLVVIGVQLGAAGQAPVKAANNYESAPAASDIARTAFDYMENFYPLWFTHYQMDYAPTNQLAGPRSVTPLYQIVVAINVDTLYASTFLSLANQPIVLNIPATQATYSILTLDGFGNIFDTGIEPEAGTYVFTGPDNQETVPLGLRQIEVPFNTSVLIFRVDRSSPAGVDQTRIANKFRKSITLQKLSAFLKGKTPRPTKILPVAAFAVPFKTAADLLATKKPISFLKQLQTAVQSSFTPLSASEQALSDRFDTLFNDGNLNIAERAEFSAGTKEAHKAIIDRYLDTRGSTNWTHFTNIGNWKKRVIDRAAITEFCQYCNGISTAAYYHAFYDKKGEVLDGTEKSGYVLHIPKKKLPDVSRFWSLTAYTPESVELVDNPADKYVVASYSPGLEYNSDGSVTLYLARKKPSGVPKANWLPVPKGQFNVMLRLYGPVDAAGYLPPAIKKN